ncbi:MAG: sulfite reductase subunit alpha [Verrucomicrobiales bacterium]|jgi:sulfite reductase (NADPH) flavoprotein alpha-component|nr:sulfite reductase subunit alpha [Verrucomicrobiales bacterium]
MESILPLIPESAPFTVAQRLWLNGYLAGLLSTSTDGPAISSRPKVRVPVLYASQTGNSAALAESFAEQLCSSGFDAPCFGTDDIPEFDLTSEKHVLIVSSTWGDGDPPDNAVDFWSALNSGDHPRLENLSYSVLALGDTNYLNFCAQGKAFDSRLESLGARRISPRADCDTDFEEAAAQWFEGVLVEIRKLDQGNKSPDQVPSGRKPVEKGYTKKNPFPAKLIENRELNSSGAMRDTRHFSLDLNGSGLTYEVGDVLGVYPRNNPLYVDELIGILGFASDAPVAVPLRGQIPLRDALIESFDVTSLNRKVVTDWSSVSSSSYLKELVSSDDSSAIGSFVEGRELIDLVIDHPSDFADPGEFLSLLKPMAPRLYSISSSPRAHPGEVHLTVAKVTYETHNRHREGVCSTCLSDRIEIGQEVPVFFQSASHFRLPLDGATDVIMCGPGTGIAPFRAFLEEREATRASGKNWLFFGNPHEATDFLYRDQLTGMCDTGVLDRLDLAWSRDGEAKIYVQDRMFEQGAELWRWFQNGAHFYICGDAKRMAKDVDRVLHEIATTHGGLSEEGAINYIKQLTKEKRYQRDVY